MLSIPSCSSASSTRNLFSHKPICGCLDTGKNLFLLFLSYTKLSKPMPQGHAFAKTLQSQFEPWLLHVHSLRMCSLWGKQQNTHLGCRSVRNESYQETVKEMRGKRKEGGRGVSSCGTEQHKIFNDFFFFLFVQCSINQTPARVRTRAMLWN